MGETQKSNKKLLYGVGFNGFGNNNDKSYTTWTNMFKRCYSEKLRNQPTYIDCKVDERWFDFNVYLEWFNDNYKDGYQLDKDILIKGNNKYSLDTCCFVPAEINGTLTIRKLHRGDLPLGVSVDCATKKFKARCGYDGKRLSLGLFDTPEEAFNAYVKTKKKELFRLATKYKGEIEDKVYFALINYDFTLED